MFLMNFERFVRSFFRRILVIPANAGIQLIQIVLDSCSLFKTWKGRVCRSEGLFTFCENIFSRRHERAKKSSLKSLIFIFGMIFLVSLAFAQSPAERPSSPPTKLPYKVAILPMKIHSAENLGFMQEGLLDMLSSRVELEGRVAVLEKGPVKKAFEQVEGEMSEEKAKKIGLWVEADFVIFGSLTKLGDSASLDLKVVGVKEGKPGFSVFVQAKKMEEIVASVDELARKVDEKILGYPLKPQVAAKPAEAEKEAPKGIPAMPPITPPIKESGAVAGGQFWQSQPFPFHMKGMAVGDVDGDGRNEVVLIAEKTLQVYRWDREFKLLWKRESGKLDTYMAVDVADVDKDGRAEIFVTNMQGDRLASFVVAFKDGAFRTVSSGMEWFMRVVEWGEKGKVLLGQYKGYRDEGFAWPIYELGWDGKTYKEMRKADLPRIYSIYGFAPFIQGGKTTYLFIDSNFYLKAFDQKGKMVWRSRDDYGSENYFQAKPFSGGAGYDDGDEWGFVNVRVISRGDEVFIIRNISAIGQILKRQAYYNRGIVQRLYWTGALFVETWKSQEIPGYLVDFQIQDVDNNRERDLILSVNLPKESMFSFEKNSALMVSRLKGVQ